MECGAGMVRKWGERVLSDDPYLLLYPFPLGVTSAKASAFRSRASSVRSAVVLFGPFRLRPGAEDVRATPTMHQVPTSQGWDWDLGTRI